MTMLAALLLTAGAAQSAGQPVPVHPAPWQPTTRYVIAGQDEPGYRHWYMSAPWRASAVGSFNDYLETWGVAGIVPTWQLLRTASDWHRCGAPPFEVPPSSQWPNIVQTLRYVRDNVIPAVGPVEPVSVYRNPLLNVCAGGSRQSAHLHTQAIDFVPLRPITREALMRDLCAVHARSGAPYGVGLGFYAFVRFHIDSRRFRKWGYGDVPGDGDCRSAPGLTVEPQLPKQPDVEASGSQPQ